MYPELLNLGFLHVHTYGVCMAAGFLLCWHLIERLTGRRDLSSLLVILMLAGVTGSRAAYVIEHWSEEFATEPLAVFSVWNGGLMFYGGLLLAIAAFFAWCFWRRERPLELADVLTAVIPLGHACGRIGCFFYGCCYGRRSDAVLAVAFPRRSAAWCEQVAKGLIPSTADASLPVLPTQLFEAAALLVLFAVLLTVYRRLYAAPAEDRRRGCVVGSYLIGYAFIRYGLEFLRGDPRAQVGPFSISQFISLLMMAAGLGLLFFARRRKS